MTERLTYANVMATVAVFLALGTGAYAVGKINGRDIRNHSIPSKKFTRNAIVPRAQIARTVAKLAVTGTSPASPSPNKKKKGSRGATAAAESNGDSLLQLSVGETKTVLERPPFTFRASCVDRGGGDYRISETVTSSEGGWIANSGVTHAAGESVTVFDGLPPGMGTGSLFVRPSGVSVVAAPGGTAVGLFAAGGVRMAGADCVLYQFAIG